MKRVLITLCVLSMVVAANAQEKEVKWEFGGGLRFNYLKLSGGLSGYSAESGTEYNLNYEDIGMSSYAPSLSIALGGRYGRWNLAFGASRGSYTGSFVTQNDIERDDIFIPAGSHVDGKIDMGIYALTTTFAIIRKKHDLGVGLGFLFLNMGMEFKTEGETLGSDNFFPMPYLAASGRLNFGRFKISGVGGGAIYHGTQDDYVYDVLYYIYEVRSTYEFYKKDNWTATVSVGYRSLFMDSEAEKEGSWFKEEDRYKGPFVSLRIKWTQFKDVLGLED